MVIAGAPALAACGTQAPTPDAIAASVELERLRVDRQLSEIGPDGWHRIALYGNWDFIETGVWRWIVSRPDCDRATALAIFWKAQPEHYLAYAQPEDVPASERAHYELIALIRERWLAGRYTRNELAFDPDGDAWPLDMAALERRYGERAQRLLPAAMRLRLPGRHIPDEGRPLPGVIRS